MTIKQFEKDLASVSREYYNAILKDPRLAQDMNMFLQAEKTDEFIKKSLMNNFYTSAGTLDNTIYNTYKDSIAEQFEEFFQNFIQSNNIVDEELKNNLRKHLDKTKNNYNLEIQNLVANNALKKITSLFPEIEALFGLAESSPEGNQKLGTNNFADRVAGEQVQVDRTAVEADRTFFGLILLFDVIAGNKARFPHLTQAVFDELREYTLEKTSNPRDFKFIVYQLAANDLGKTQKMIDLHQQLFNFKAEDHDKLLANLVTRNPDIFTGMLKHLDQPLLEAYAQGLNADLNLGQMVQAENLPANIGEIQKIPEFARKIRLFVELFDFLGVTGHVNSLTTMPFIANNDNVQFYMRACHELTQEPVAEAYDRYLAYRAHKVGAISEENIALLQDQEQYALARLICLCRIADKSSSNPSTMDFDTLAKVWKWEGFDSIRNILIRELSRTGIDDSAILLYYSPAVIANAIKKFGKEQGTQIALYSLVSVLTYVRENISEGHTGVFTENINVLAKEFNIQGDYSVLDYSLLLDYLSVEKSERKMKLLYKHRGHDFYVLSVCESDAANYREVEVTHEEYRRILATPDMFYQSSESTSWHISPVTVTVEAAEETKEEDNDDEFKPVAEEEPGSELKRYEDDEEGDDGHGGGNNPGGSDGKPLIASTGTSTSNQNAAQSSSSSSNSNPKDALEVFSDDDSSGYDVFLKAIIPVGLIAIAVYDGSLTSGAINVGKGLISSAISSEADATSSYVTQVVTEGVKAIGDAIEYYGLLTA